MFLAFVLLLLSFMKLTSDGKPWRLLLQAVQAATEYVLVVVWSTAAIFGLLVVRGPHAHDRFYLTLLWAMTETHTFLMWGTLLFFVAWGLHRVGIPLLALRILGGVAAPTLAILIARRSFFYLLDQPGYYWIGPLIFLAEFVLCGFLYGVLLLPRHFKPDAAPRLHIHWAVFALFVPFAQSLILHTVNPGLPGSIFSVGSPKVAHLGEVIFARWTPGADPLTVEPFDMRHPPPRGGLFPEPDNSRGTYVTLSEDEIQLLRSEGVTGQVKVLGMSTLHDAGRLVLVLSQQVDAPLQFFTPAEGAKVIYLQTSAGWQKLPPQAGDSKSLARLYIPEGKPDLTGFELDIGSGFSGRGQTPYFWDHR